MVVTQENATIWLADEVPSLLGWNDVGVAGALFTGAEGGTMPAGTGAGCVGALGCNPPNIAARLHPMSVLLLY